MHSLVLRCLIALLSLALVSGNARAELHLGAAPHSPCPAQIHHDRGDTPHHRDSADYSCCCDCLGSASAIEPTPDLASFIPAFPPASVLYAAANPLLTGRVLRPEPGPPRPGSLS